MIKKLNEAKSINNEYADNWTDIPRDIFDQLISLDPGTNMDKENIGYIAKQLILPCYLKGEQDIIKFGKQVTEAIKTYMQNRGNYPAVLRNVANFPSVKDFTEYVLLGDESEFAKNFNPDALSTANSPTASPIDAVFDKYYAKDISRDNFNTIISLDPETNDKHIGYVAKNLLLPKFISGEKDFLNRKDEVRDSIELYNKNKEKLPSNYRDISNFKSVDKFIYITHGNDDSAESDLLKYLKNNPRTGYTKYIDRLEYLGSTWDYDIFRCKDHIGNAAVAGSANPEKSTQYSKFSRGHWCTTTRQFWHNYRDGGAEYFDFISKSKPTADNRIHNYQFAIRPDGSVRQVADGFEHSYGPGQAADDLIRRYLSEDPGVIPFLLSKHPDSRLLKIPVIQDYILAEKYRDTVFVYAEPEGLFALSPDKEKIKIIGKYIKEVRIDDTVTNIPAGTFAGWSSLQKVTFSDTITNIGAQAFKNSGLETLKLPAKIEKIGTEAFANCALLHGTTYLPASLTSIGLRAFNGTKINLTVSKDRSLSSLNIFEEDIPWFSRHLSIKDVANEDLNEEILDENIPKDLAHAYRRIDRLYSSNAFLSTYKDAINGSSDSRVRDDTFDSTETSKKSQHYELSNNFSGSDYGADYKMNYNPNDDNNIQKNYDGNQRPYVTYDYYNSSYEQISPQEAIRRVEHSRSDINKLRVLMDGQVVEWALKNSGNFYNVYKASLSSDKIRKLEDLGYGDVTNGTTAYANTWSKIKLMLEVADKIYWTDEYDHLITLSTPSSKNIKIPVIQPDKYSLDIMSTEPVLDAEGNEVLDDNGNPITKIYQATPQTIHGQRDLKSRVVKRLRSYKPMENDTPRGDHNPSSHFIDNKIYSIPVIPDTGSHNPNNIFRDRDYHYDESLPNYIKSLHAKKVKFKKFDNVRHAIKQLEKNRDLYDDDEYEARLDYLEKYKKELYDAYLVACKNVNIYKKVLHHSFDLFTANLNRKLLNKIEIISKYKTDIYQTKENLKKALVKEINVANIGKEETAELNSKLVSYNNEIKYFNDQITNLEEVMRTCRESIEEYTKNIKDREESVSSIINELNAMKNDFDELAEKEAKKIVTQELELENKLKDLETYLTNNFKIKFPTKEAKEMSDQLKGILNVVSLNNSSNDANTQETSDD